MESSPESSITQDFNPFVPTAAPQGMGATGLIYEPLYQFDLASPSVSYPWLATAYKWSDGGKAITFTIRQGVKWNDGTPLTPADVAFTYQLMKKNAAINLGGLNISTVTSSGDTVTVTFPTSQYMNLQQVAGVAILPQAVWSKAGNPATFTDANPVGTGPYMLSSFTPRGLHAGEEPALLAAGLGPEGLLPGLHLEHRRAERPVLRARSTGRATTSPACRRSSSTPTPPTTTSGRRRAARTA